MILRPGTFLQDRYEILEQIGSGGMSVVYKAKCHKLNRLVAIKVLKEEFSSDANFVGKFKMEAQAAAGLSHPNIVSVYDVIDEGQLHYIVMELIEGITLKSYIVKKGRLEIKESIGIAIQVAQGIAAAHEQHIIHRDIKPQNMIISKDGKVKVADFGIARAVSAQTLSSAAMGSVHYISPEQARGGFSDERSDIYSLGITMYEMVTGRVPFEGDNTVSIALAHLEDVIVPPSVYNPDIPVSLERIILKCTEKKPERRYSGANELIADLRQALVQPDGDFVKTITKSGALDGETVSISSQELAQIKERSRFQEVDATKNLAKEYREEAAAAHRPERDYKPERGYKADRDYKDGRDYKDVRDPRRERKRRDEDGDEVNPRLERMLAAAGIVAAIIIVAVVIVVFAKLSGLFRFGSPEVGTQPPATVASTVDPSAENSGLSDTQVLMPDVLGLDEDTAQGKLKESLLTMKPVYENSDDIPQGKVVSQDPKPGDPALKGSGVTVVVSLGSDKIDLAELGIGELDGNAAKKLLTDKGLVVEVAEEENETKEAGRILRYEPEKVAPGGTVKLYVSSGPHVDMATVPIIAGKSEEEALALLGEAGLSAGSMTVQSSDSVPAGYLISQAIPGGTQVEPGSSVGYVISSGPEVHNQRYVASINEVYDLSGLIGPGAGSSSVTVMIRLHQGTADNPLYKVLTNAVQVKGDVLLPVSFTSIESMDGTDKGEVEVVNVDTGQVLRSYPLTFFPMD